MYIIPLSGIRYDTYIGLSSRMSPLLSWQGLDQPSYLQTSSQLYSSSWPRHISCLAVTLLISLRRFLLPLAVDFVSLTNKGLSVLERHIVPRSTLNKLLNLWKKKTIYEIHYSITIHLKLVCAMNAIVVSYCFKRTLLKTSIAVNKNFCLLQQL